MNRENKMGSMPVGKLLINMSLPIIIAMLVQALYNVVDTYFVSKIGIDAVTALSDAFPIQSLRIGVATGTGVGVNALLSKALGEKDSTRANKIAVSGIWLAGVGYLIFLFFGIFFSSFYFNKMTDSAIIAQMGEEYLWICTVFSFGIFGEIMFERLMQATGKTIYTMFTQGIGAVINIILDPLLIRGFGKIPAMGVKGAAIATVVGQIISMLLAAVLNHCFNQEIRLGRTLLHPELRICGRIYSIGIPSIIMVAIGSIMTMSMNLILKGIDTTEISVAVFGIYFKLQSFVFMPVFGLNNGLIPIIAFNYGAQNRKRMMKAFGYAVTIAFAIMTVGLLIFHLIPDKLLMIFEPENVDNTLLRAFGVPALRIISLCFPFAAVGIVISSVFQALGKAVNSMLISMARQLLVLIPVAYLLSLTGNVITVWWAIPVAETVSLIVSLLLFTVVYKRIIQHVSEGNN